MLDVYNQLAAAVRSHDNDSVADLNERLRTVFKEVRIDTVDKNTVGLLPVLRDDVLDRYGISSLSWPTKPARHPTSSDRRPARPCSGPLTRRASAASGNVCDVRR